jgi:N-acetylglucosaminyldiphosphoundecaprenol N-acetyl-beta-D-mannosaminyltransferase
MDMSYKHPDRMKKYFDIYLEFDRSMVSKIISDKIEQKQKGYVCVVDGNVLTTSFKINEYKKIINGSSVNICDGSSIALLLGVLHQKRFRTYTGPEIFLELSQKNFSQYILGNTDENLLLLQRKFDSLGMNQEKFRFKSIPFRKVGDFDYESIANDIKLFSPDIVWVSLGAPKQEIFMSKLIRYLDKGVLFGIGAAVNLFLDSDNNKRAPRILRVLNLEWLFRVIQEPGRVGKRALSYLAVLPDLIYQELKTIRN